MNDFYVYAWIRPDTGTTFYIGKGCRNRDTKLKSGNRIFMAIIAKLRRLSIAPLVVRLHTDLTEADALDLERQEIARHGRICAGTGTLSNITEGGDGVIGYRHSSEARRKIGAAHKGRKYGPASEAAKARLSAASIGRPKESQHVANIGSAQRLSPPRRDNRTGFKGVSFHKSIGKYCANAFLNGEQKALGAFATPEEAARAYDKAAFAAWGADCYLNFPVEIAA